MRYDTIHETAISDIAATIKGGLTVAKDTMSNKRSGVAYSGSLTKATKGLVMEFPVLISKANHIESAGIVAKAYEAKFVTLLQLAFAASNITNAKEGIDFVKNFHTNLNDKMNVDDFIDVMDHYVKESALNAESYAQFKAVTEDLKNLSYYFDEDINESSLNSYSVMKNYGNLKVVKEAGKYTADDKFEYQMKKDEIEAEYRTKSDDVKNKREYEKLGYQKLHDTIKDKHDQEKFAYQQKHDSEKDTFEKEKFGYQKGHDAQRDEYQRSQDNIKNQRDDRKEVRDTAKHSVDMMKVSQDIIANNIVSSDLKKANEMVPTMMVVNFVYQEEGSDAPAIMRQMVIGIKAKLYEVEPMDVINKILTKNTDSNILLKLVQVSTRQISFVKDFLFAIDDAKVDALSRSKRGSSNKLFKVLERRALKGKIRKALNIKNLSKAISSLVISQEEAEELLKNNVDVSNPAVIRPIMEKLNLISFAIIDESSESVKFIYDTGDDVYETIPLSKLEREQKDGMSKKVINLMAKMNR